MFVLQFFALGASDTEWQRWNVVSHLHNDGTVLVSETMTVRLNGGVTTLERRLPARTDQEIIIKRFVRLSGPEAVEIKPDGSLEGDRYVWHEGRLSWSIKPTNGGMWENETVGFELEYEFRNGLAPIWDVAAGPDSLNSRRQFPHLASRFRETLEGWRQGLSTGNRRYRFDHDILFAALPATGPVELQYTFKYDEAWLNRGSNELQARATPNVDYRVTEIRDYLPPGTPTAIEWWRPLVRVGSIAVLALLALLLWLIFCIGEIRRNGLMGKRIDRQWFTREVLPQVPEVLAVSAGATRTVSLFRLFLHRMREKGVLTLHPNEKMDEDGDPIHVLRLVRNPSELPGFERDFTRRLFGDRHEIDSEGFYRTHSQEGFNPEEELEDAIDEHSPPNAATPAARPSRFWAIVRGLSSVLFVGAGILIVIETLLQEGTRLMGTMVFVGIGLLVISWLIANLRKPASTAITALLMLVPILLIIPVVIVLHLIGTLPIGPFGSIGVALFALWWVAAILRVTRGDVADSTPGAVSAEMARNYVRKQLRRRNPALDDAWMPHLIALGCYEAVNQWRRERKSAAGAITSPTLPGQLPSIENLRPFVGDLSGYPDEEWTDAFYVLSEVERKEWEEDEDEEAEKERPR